jgi:glucose-1-phosphate adenylyltransferase
VDSSVLFAGVTIEKGAAVNYSIIMPGTTVKAGAVVQYSIVGENRVIEENATVGGDPATIEDKDNWGVAVVGHGVGIKANTAVPPKAMIDKQR